MRNFFSSPRFALLSLAATATLAMASQAPLMAQDGPTRWAANPSLPSLEGLLTVDRRLSLFYDYVRDVNSVTLRLSSDAVETTLLVPLNSAILSLPRKPHQSPPPSGAPALPDEDTLTIAEQDDLVSSNTERFIFAHVVPQTIDLSSEGELTFPTLLAGVNVTLAPGPEDGFWTVGNGKVKVVNVLEGRNGRVFVLDGVLEVDQ